MILVFAGVLSADPALANKPSWSENGQSEKQERKEDYKHQQNYEQAGHQGMEDHGKKEHGKWSKSDKDQKGHGHSGKSDKGKNDYGYSQKADHGKGKHDYFKSRDREVIHDYFAEQFRRGHCPPGLAKKANGCMPPGHTRRWEIGHQLPREVIFYNLPPRVLERLEPPPPRHRYVRVAQDILLITVGTGMVVDAIEDLGNIY